MYLSFHLYILNTHQIEDYVYDSTSKKGLLQFIMLVMIHFYLSNRRDEIILENKVAENQRDLNVKNLNMFFGQIIQCVRDGFHLGGLF